VDAEPKDAIAACPLGLNRRHAESGHLFVGRGRALRYLTLLFLRRYVTYCARTRRFAAMEGAALLHRQLTNG